MKIEQVYLQQLISLLIKTAGDAAENEIIQNKELVGQLHKPIIKVIKKICKSTFIENICGADLADM